MIPIHVLLHRIQWDPEFGKGTFMIGYYDRIDAEIVRVPFRRNGALVWQRNVNAR